MKIFKFLIKILLIAGAINWGLVGFINYNFVADIFGGSESMIVKIVYMLVGVAGVLSLTNLFCSSCKPCQPCDKEEGNVCSTKQSSCQTQKSCGCNCGPNCSCCKKKREE